MENNNHSHSLNSVKNYLFPTPDNMGKGGVYQPGLKTGDVKKDLRNYITPVQLQRIRQDIAQWRAAIGEAENAWSPHRVRMQRMYIDTILEGHTLACVKKRKDLSLLREWTFKDEAGNENEKLKKLFKKKWFNLFLEYALEAKFYGYSLITLGDVVNDTFPELGIIRRFNVSPDRLNVTSYVYSISGDKFLEEPFSKWHVWVPTPSDVGVSKCGYGELYSVARYEILLRNLLGQNSDAAELYGQPMIWGKSTKTEGPERDMLEAAIANRGSAGYMLTDPTDELELIESKGNGQGFKIYPDLELRLEKKISKLLLGHADAIDSIPGKLGNSGEKSPAEIALTDKQTSDGKFLEDVVNDSLIPKLIALGFSIDPAYRFTFGNNAEKNELRANEDKNNLATADVMLKLKQAGFKADPKYITERTGIPVTEVVEKVEPPKVTEKLSDKVMNRLKSIYT